MFYQLTAPVLYKQTGRVWSHRHTSCWFIHTDFSQIYLSYTKRHILKTH